MRVIVPYAVESPKSRLAPVLTADERVEFARSMLDDVLATLDAAGVSPEVLATAPVELDLPVHVDERPLTEAVNAVIRDGVPVAVVMADLALLTTDAVHRLFDAAGDVVLAPGRAGGTNAFLTRDPAFRVDYHGASYLDHMGIARGIGASVRVLDSHRLATDMDEPDDLVELLIHGEGRSAGWLEDAGFRLDRHGGRVTLTRENGP